MVIQGRSTSCRDRLTGVVDDTNDGLEANCEAEGDADVGIAMDEIGCAVDRVNDEGGSLSQTSAWFVGLFAHESGADLVYKVAVEGLGCALE